MTDSAIINHLMGIKTALEAIAEALPKASAPNWTTDHLKTDLLERMKSSNFRIPVMPVATVEAFGIPFDVAQKIAPEAVNQLFREGDPVFLSDDIRFTYSQLIEAGKRAEYDTPPTCFRESSHLLSDKKKAMGEDSDSQYTCAHNGVGSCPNCTPKVSTATIEIHATKAAMDELKAKLTQSEKLAGQSLSDNYRNYRKAVPDLTPDEAAGLRAINEFMNQYSGSIPAFAGNTDHNETDLHAALAVANIKPAFLTAQILTLYMVAHGWQLDTNKSNEVWAVYVNPLVADYLGDPVEIVLPRNPKPKDPTVINYVTSALQMVQATKNNNPLANARVAGLLAIHDERERQDQKWGIQNHEPASYLSILTEEIGEASEAVNNIIFSGNDLANDVHRELFDQLNAELIQIAAVALAFVECNKRNYPYSDNAPYAIYDSPQ